MQGYLNARAWLAQMKMRAKITRKGTSDLSEQARLGILINLVWAPALVHPDQEEEITNMINATLLSPGLSLREVYKEARAIAKYLNSMT